MQLYCALVRLVLGAALVLPQAGRVEGEVFYAQDEAREIAFPGADKVEVLTFILSDAEKAKAEKLARTSIESNLFTFYEGIKNGQVMGYSAIESNIVRTLPETFLVVLTPEGKIKKTVMLAFHEPLDYLPSERWMEQFENRALDNDLWPQRGIVGIVGSTLSVRAVTKGVRKVLALFQVLIKER